MLPASPSVRLKGRYIWHEIKLTNIITWRTMTSFLKNMFYFKTKVFPQYLNLGFPKFGIKLKKTKILGVTFGVDVFFGICLIFKWLMVCYEHCTIRHVQKTPFIINLLGWLTFICILVPRSIFDLNFLKNVMIYVDII